MNLWSQNFSQKTNEKLQEFLPYLSGQKSLQFFVRFLGEVLARQFCFEINWPLTVFLLPLIYQLHIAGLKCICKSFHWEFFWVWHSMDTKSKVANELPILSISWKFNDLISWAFTSLHTKKTCEYLVEKN